MTTEIIVPVPDLRRTVIRPVSDAEALHAQILSAAERTAAWLRAPQAALLSLNCAAFPDRGA